MSVYKIFLKDETFYIPMTAFLLDLFAVCQWIFISSD
jgi:hypothetical protein